MVRTLLFPDFLRKNMVPEKFCSGMQTLIWNVATDILLVCCLFSLGLGLSFYICLFESDPLPVSVFIIFFYLHTIHLSENYIAINTSSCEQHFIHSKPPVYGSVIPYNSWSGLRHFVLNSKNCTTQPICQTTGFPSISSRTSTKGMENFKYTTSLITKWEEISFAARLNSIHCFCPISVVAIRSN